MVFDVDPDKPNIPALARILSGMGVLCLIGSAISGMLAFSSYSWVNESYAMVGAVSAFLLALVFIGQAKTLELLAIVSARVKSRYAIDNMTRTLKAPSSSTSAETTPSRITQPVKERVIHVSEEQARQQGFKVR